MLRRDARRRQYHTSFKSAAGVQMHHRHAPGRTHAVQQHMAVGRGVRIQFYVQQHNHVGCRHNPGHVHVTGARKTTDGAGCCRADGGGGSAVVGGSHTGAGTSTLRGSRNGCGCGCSRRRHRRSSDRSSRSGCAGFSCCSNGGSDGAPPPRQRQRNRRHTCVRGGQLLGLDDGARCDAAQTHDASQQGRVAVEAVGDGLVQHAVGRCPRGGAGSVRPVQAHVRQPHAAQECFSCICCEGQRRCDDDALTGSSGLMQHSAKHSKFVRFTSELQR